MKYKPLVKTGEKYCPKCHQVKPLGDFAGGWCRDCRSQSRGSGGEDEELRSEMIRRYGGKCEICDENHPAALVVTPSLGTGMVKLARRLKSENWPSGYHIVCLNCKAKEKQYG